MFGTGPCLPHSSALYAHTALSSHLNELKSFCSLHASSLLFSRTKASAEIGPSGTRLSLSDLRPTAHKQNSSALRQRGTDVHTYRGLKGTVHVRSERRLQSVPELLCESQLPSFSAIYQLDSLCHWLPALSQSAARGKRYYIVGAAIQLSLPAKFLSINRMHQKIWPLGDICTSYLFLIVLDTRGQQTHVSPTRIELYLYTRHDLKM